MSWSFTSKFKIVLLLITFFCSAVTSFCQCTTTYNSVNVAACSNELPYVFGGMNISFPGTYKDTLVNAGGCDSIITLNLTINAVVSSSTAISICSTELPYTLQGQTYNAAGVYTQTLTATSGCDSIATLLLFVSPPGEWTGAAGTSWEDAANWSCNIVPGSATAVVINAGTIVVHANTSIYSLGLGPDANLTIQPGVQFTILH